MKNTIEINNPRAITEHIRDNAITIEVKELVEVILDKLDRKRTKWVDKKLTELKEEHTIDLILRETLK